MLFPLSDWTELDIWQYIWRERIELPSIYYAHQREVVERDGMLLAVSEWVSPAAGEEVRKETVRFRTVGDATCTGVVISSADTVEEIIREVSASGSPSVAPPGPTTAFPRPPWKTASARGTSRPMTTLPGSPPVGGPERGVDTMDLLRFATIGSVDDGKSTLIGRLLFDTRQLFDDQFTAIETASERRGLGNSTSPS